MPVVGSSQSVASNPSTVRFVGSTEGGYSTGPRRLCYAHPPLPMPVVHHIVPHFHSGAAVGPWIVDLQALLRRQGAWGEIYAERWEQGLKTLVRPASQL